MCFRVLLFSKNVKKKKFFQLNPFGRSRTNANSAFWSWRRVLQSCIWHFHCTEINFSSSNDTDHTCYLDKLIACLILYLAIRNKTESGWRYSRTVLCKAITSRHALTLCLFEWLLVLTWASIFQSADMWSLWWEQWRTISHNAPGAECKPTTVRFFPTHSSATP